ncbi:hypothetical protein N8827_00640 [Pelagibacteraceae bacterium]|nr:hypothetical protein [Pelagibacteraceae bacterium]
MIQILNKILYKKNYYIFFLIVSSYFFTYYYGFIGIFPIDSFLIYDAGYKVLNGYHPFKDYWSITGPILDYIQFVFFNFFGTNWLSYVLHAATINLLITIVFFYFFTQLEIKLIYSFLYSLSTSILAYPSIGTPFADHHAVIFSAVSVVFLILAFIKDRPIYWFLTPVFLFISFLSKQIPSAYLLIFFLIFIFLFWILFSSKNYKFLIYLLCGTVLSLFIFISFLLINKIPFDNFLTQYLYYPLEIGKDRGSRINFNLNNVFFQFKFIYFSLLPLIFVFYKLTKKKINEETKKDYFLLFFVLITISLFILAQILTKNQILIFFLIPFLLGISHYFSKKYKNSRIVIIFLISILVISTTKFHLRFNENKKFMELSNVDLRLAVKASALDKSLDGLKWITPNNSNPDAEIYELIKIKKIISSDNTKKIIISDYQILPSILNLKNISPNKWFDSLSVPNKNNKYFKDYKDFFIESLKSQNIETIFVFKDKEKYLENILNNDCYIKKNINKNLFKIIIKKCFK